MIGLNRRTGYEHHSTIELDEVIRENQNYTKPALSLGESEYEKAVREKSKRIQNSEFEAKEQFDVNVQLLQKQQRILQDHHGILQKQYGSLEGILSELARPWYKTANGWFSFIAMTAAIVGVVLVFI